MSVETQVAVVIPSWNSAALLPALLDSLSVGPEEVELFVVDNGSRDGTLALLRERGVRHLALPRNVGFAAAMNRGVAETKAPFVLGLNADTVVVPGAIGTLLAALSADPDLGGVQPRILQLGAGGSTDISSARLYSAGMALTADGRAIETGAGEAQVDQWLRAREIFGVCGAAFLMRRSLFTEVGGYDESYVSFYEDVDLNVRARIAGWRFAYVPDAVVWHVGNASWQAGFDRPGAENARLVARNRLVTQAKFMPASATPRIVAVEFGALVRAALRRRLLATLHGKLEGLLRLHYGLWERRRLAEKGDSTDASRWLGVDAPRLSSGER
ncbi:MAG: glycosyltransferase family 2 protein [Actinobacteria bacterium]|nr:glycosyltransferase family 2 protein [Actinomycetota bacterium]